MRRFFRVRRGTAKSHDVPKRTREILPAPARGLCFLTFLGAESDKATTKFTLDHRDANDASLFAGVCDDAVFIF